MTKPKVLVVANEFNQAGISGLFGHRLDIVSVVDNPGSAGRMEAAVSRFWEWKDSLDAVIIVSGFKYFWALVHLGNVIHRAGFQKPIIGGFLVPYSDTAFYKNATEIGFSCAVELDDLSKTIREALGITPTVLFLIKDLLPSNVWDTINKLKIQPLIANYTTMAQQFVRDHGGMIDAVFIENEVGVLEDDLPGIGHGAAFVANLQKDGFHRPIYSVGSNCENITGMDVKDHVPEAEGISRILKNIFG